MILDDSYLTYRETAITVEVDEKTTIKVKNVFQRDFNGLTPQYDIALVELVQPFQ